jgi:hypothetical protein
MADTPLSLGVVNGVGTDNWTKLSNVVVGTNAPSAGVDFEFRAGLTDASGHTISRIEMVKALKAFLAVVESHAIFTKDLQF